MKSFLKILVIALLLFLSYFAAINIKNRYVWDKETQSITFLLDIDENVYEQVNKEEFFNRIFELGIKSIILNWDERFIDNFNFLSQKGFNIGIKVIPDKNYDFKLIESFIRKNRDKIFTVLVEPINYKISNSRIINIGTNFLLPKIGDLVRKNDLICLNFEFNKETLGKVAKIKQNVARTFVLDTNLLDKDYLLKVRKAIKERSCKVIYIVTSEFLSLEEKSDIIRNVVLQNKNVFSQEFNFKKYSTINFGKIYKITNIIVFFLHMVGLIFCYKYFTKKIKIKEINFFAINFVNIFIGILSYGLLQSYDYVVLNENISGIKFMFLLPIIILSLTIFELKDLKIILNYNLKIKDLIISFFAFLGIYYIVIRMGNISRDLVLSYELMFRNFIENIILFRPRFKEVFFGQPILVFALFLLKKAPKNIFGKMFLWLSVIGQVSILNTFLHVHTPIHINILRTITGMLIGLVLGKFLIVLYKQIILFFRKTL